MFNSRWLIIAIIAFTSASYALAQPVDSIMNPADFTSQGSLSVNSGTITIDTDALTFDAPGASFSGFGEVGMSQSGMVDLAVFTFDSIDIGGGVTNINVMGSRGLAILSNSDFTLGADISLNGDNAMGSMGGAAAPGADGAGGDGGLDGAGMAGGGQGGGAPGGPNQTAGGGAGYANPGGDAAGSGGMGGSSYGDAALTNLYGGSGGGGAQHVNDINQANGGGGGGGALELVALGTLTLDGNLSATGGDGDNQGSGGFEVGGGGGSGGGILLAAMELEFNSLIDVAGGDGGDTTQATRAGGGGSGGRVALYVDALVGSADVGTDILLGGGTGFGNAEDGGVGSLSQAAFPAQLAPIPEPSSWLLFAICAVTAILGSRAITRQRR